ncbi:FtsZ-binding cell division protein ZapB [Moryella indoligenes]|uniref:FtsZ-binding cell division protein ZapB n=2 Tax=Moryella indoligenes TaxID=371674 RepID=A0AAE4AJZ7_9FIRM|nr:FtsZ-binding cell division protein ZapB [Moryella indoligenes]
MRERIRRMNDPHYLHTVSMTELYQTAYKSRPPVIDGLLYSGAYILAGAPKIGKSFLVAQLAYHVSTGQRLWGYEVHQGTVLYLALEDDFQRIQSRMFMMYGVADTASLHFATAANKIGNGLDEQLENFVREHPDTKLIIIDTMQKIREAGGEAYSYASDYKIIGKLKRFADRHSICIVTVHHTRKQPAGDSFETISGTTGLLGCADGALLMQKKKRTALEATVDAVGRDQQDQILYLKKDADTQIWSLERTENKPHQEPPDPVLDTVSQLVSSESREWAGSPTELAEAVNTGMVANALTHVVYIPVVEKQILWTKRCKDKSLVGTVKETIQQVSMSKKWDSKPALDEHGKPLLNANGKTVLRKSYSVLQDDFFAAMRKAGYDDVERGERGSSEEHLTVTQFKVQQEQARLAAFTEQNRQQEKQAATLGSKIEKIQNQRVDVRSIEKIVATSIPFSSKVAVEREDFDRISTLAKKYVTAEKKESKLQKAVDAANKLIAKLKAEIDSLKQEISDYKSVHSKLRAAELERENTELRGKVRSYEDVIQRNNLWRFFHPLREKAVTRDEAR